MIENKTWIITLLICTQLLVFKLIMMNWKLSRVYRLWTYRFNHLYCSILFYFYWRNLLHDIYGCYVTWCCYAELISIMSSSLRVSGQFVSSFSGELPSVTCAYIYIQIQTFSQAAEEWEDAAGHVSACHARPNSVCELTYIRPRLGLSAVHRLPSCTKIALPASAVMPLPRVNKLSDVNILG
jgi:hypothetical protein